MASAYPVGLASLRQRLYNLTRHAPSTYWMNMIFSPDKLDCLAMCNKSPNPGGRYFAEGQVWMTVFPYLQQVTLEPTMSRGAVFRGTLEIVWD